MLTGLNTAVLVNALPLFWPYAQAASGQRQQVHTDPLSLDIDSPGACHRGLTNDIGSAISCLQAVPVPVRGVLRTTVTPFPSTIAHQAHACPGGIDDTSEIALVPVTAGGGFRFVHQPR